MGLELAREKGVAPILDEEFSVSAEMLRKRPEMKQDGWESRRQCSRAVVTRKVQSLYAETAEVAQS